MAQYGYFADMKSFYLYRIRHYLDKCISVEKGINMSCWFTVEVEMSVSSLNCEFSHVLICNHSLTDKQIYSAQKRLISRRSKICDSRGIFIPIINTVDGGGELVFAFSEFSDVVWCFNSPLNWFSLVQPGNGLLLGNKPVLNQWLIVNWTLGNKLG